MITVDGQVPDAHVLVVVLIEGPANLNLVFEPSPGTVMVTVHDGRDAKLCWLLSNAIVVGLTEQPLRVPLLTGTPLATDMVMSSVTDCTTLNWLDAVFPSASTPVTV